MLAAIDWRRPWYASVRQAAQRVIDQPNLLAALNRQSDVMRLANHRGLPLRFVEQAALPEGVAYEAFISATGNVPTRDNLHDIFNALVWLSFPDTKRTLNAMQAAHIERAGVGGTRGAARDAATIFDENAALLVIADTLEGRTWLDALRNRRWHHAFVEQRRIFNQQAEVLLFGHALMQKLVKPYKGITAHAWVVDAPEQYFRMSSEQRCAWLDRTVAGALKSCVHAGMEMGRFTPLPLLGIPGWWHPQTPEFYADTSVFRVKRQ